MLRVQTKLAKLNMPSLRKTNHFGGNDEGINFGSVQATIRPTIYNVIARQKLYITVANSYYVFRSLFGY